MNRTTGITKRRLSPRATVVSGAAFGLIAGATVYGAVTSSAQDTAPAAFSVAKPPAAGSASAAKCSAGTQLENGVCVVHVTRTVMAPPSVAPSAAGAAARVEAAHAEGAVPRNVLNTNRSEGPGSERAGSEAERDADSRDGESGDERDDSRGEDREGSLSGQGGTTMAPVPTTAPAPAKAPVLTTAPAPTTAPAAAPVPTAAS